MPDFTWNLELDCEIAFQVCYESVFLFSLVVDRVWVGILHWLVWDRVTPPFNQLHKIGNVFDLNSFLFIGMKVWGEITVLYIQELYYSSALQEWSQTRGSIFRSHRFRRKMLMFDSVFHRYLCSTILSDEKAQQEERSRMEMRRQVPVSWDSGGSDEAPPKVSNCTGLFLMLLLCYS